MNSVFGSLHRGLSGIRTQYRPPLLLQLVERALLVGPSAVGVPGIGKEVCQKMPQPSITLQPRISMHRHHPTGLKGPSASKILAIISLRSLHLLIRQAALQIHNAMWCNRHTSAGAKFSDESKTAASSAFIAF
jgi:hypothetical protein